nr:hypothetical protein [Spirochaetota bacterium]
MEFLLFFGSVFASFGIVMTFRHLDKNNRSFDKVAKLSKNVKDEITLITKDKLQEVRDYNNFIDASLQRGGVLLEELNKNLKLTEQKNSALQNDKVLNLLTKVENIEKTFDGINTQIAELNETKNFSKNSTKFIKETMHEMKTIKSEINILKKELDNKKSEVADVIKKQESKFVAEVEKNKKDVIISLGKEKKYFDDNLSTYKKEIENINSLITGLKSNFIKQVEDEFDVMNRNYKLKSEEVKKEYASVEEETRKKLEEKIGDYSKYIVRVEERGENLSKKLDKDLNGAKDNYILDLKEGYTKLISELNKYNEEQRVRIKNEVASTYSDYENRYKKLISDIGNAEDNASSKLISYETFLKDSFDKLDKLKENTVDEIETKIEELNIHINNAKDMGIRLELEIFNEIKDKLGNFKSDTEGTIEKLKEGLDSKIKVYERDVETRYDASNIKIKSVENSLEEFKGRFENELRNYTETLNKLDVDKN